MNNELDGLYLIDKPEGYTSFEIVRIVKKKLEIRKAGHTGTLDKFAKGLLLVLTGKYTRLVPLFERLPKVYEGIIQFGIKTDTLDPYGKIVEKGRIPEINEVKEALADFKGEIEQIPPIYSAIHVKGKRAYKYAQRGEKVKIAPRKVIINEIDCLEYEKPFLKLRVECSKGTYIRSLARDIGVKLETCAYLKMLKRLKIGNFSIKEAIRPDEVNKTSKPRKPIDFLEFFDDIVYLKENDIEKTEKIKNGMKITKLIDCNSLHKGKIYALFDSNDELIALFKKGVKDCHYLSTFS